MTARVLVAASVLVCPLPSLLECPHMNKSGRANSLFELSAEKTTGTKEQKDHSP
jgi:hypothetical protein